MYFKDFPQFVYEFLEADGKTTRKTIITDITRNVRFRKQILANIALYDEYDIIDGETPEIIAEKFYGNSLYHWIVMLVNERFDYVKDFPLPYQELLKYVEDVYGADNINAIHHWQNDKGFVVNSDYPGATSVSNLQYEEGVNESKRRIKLISPQLLQQVLTQFKDLL